MTVQEMIDELNKVKKKDREIVVPTGYRKVTSEVCLTIEEDCEYWDRYGYTWIATKIYLGE